MDLRARAPAMGQCQKARLRRKRALHAVGSGPREGIRLAYQPPGPMLGKFNKTFERCAVVGGSGPSKQQAYARLRQHHNLLA